MSKEKLTIWLCATAIGVIVLGFLTVWALWWKAAMITAAAAASAKMIIEMDRRRKSEESVQSALDALTDTEKILDGIKDGSDEGLKVFGEELAGMTPAEKIVHAERLLGEDGK